MNKEAFFYYLIRTLTYPCRFFSYRALHLLGRGLGWIAFYFMREYRKRALSNLALATDLHLTPSEIRNYAQESFQNLAINCLEYPKFDAENHFDRVICCENPEVAQEIYTKGKGLIFFCGHQANWEALFLDGTRRMQGIAIGKSIKNKRLYHWILSIREKNGGKIIAPRNAVKEGLRALRKGSFIGIVGDQGMPDSGYCFPFFGRRAWTSTAPALLSYKTQAPILFASTKRVSGGYKIRYGSPIWPNIEAPLEQEVIRMMDHLLVQLQQSIQESPGEWLWQHNRWKQQTTHHLYKRFRQDCIAIILPKNPLPEQIEALKTLREIYAPAFLFLFLPKKWQQKIPIETEGILLYEDLKETLIEDYRFKLLFNFSSYRPIHTHYEKLSAFEILDRSTLEKLAEPHINSSSSLSEILSKALCRPGSIWHPIKQEEYAL